MASIKEIELNDVSVNLADNSCGGKLCNQCAWKTTCQRHHKMVIDHLSINTVAGKINIGVEIVECNYFIQQPPELELKKLMEDIKYAKSNRS